MTVCKRVTKCSTDGKKLKYYREECSEKAYAEQ